MSENTREYTLAIILLNWNNDSLTIECLESLMRSEFQDFKVIVVDNGSELGSVGKIIDWSQGKVPAYAGPFDKRSVTRTTGLKVISSYDVRNKSLASRSISEKIIIVKNETNEGFARGNNLGLELALQDEYDYILIQNNDTTLAEDCLGTLFDYMQTFPQYGAISPKINYYSEPDKIWYCGGKLNLLGRRKRYYLDQTDNPSRQKQTRDISFITGCCIYAKRDIFQKYGMLSERFFFGQEDYEFSLDMTEQGVPMAVVGDAIVYHMVSVTRTRMFDYDPLPDILVGYLNRFVSRKLRAASRYSWFLWKWMNLGIVTVRMATKYRPPLKRLMHFIKLLSFYAEDRDTVDKDFVFSAKDELNKWK